MKTQLYGLPLRNASTSGTGLVADSCSSISNRKRSNPTRGQKHGAAPFAERSVTGTRDSVLAPASPNQEASDTPRVFPHQKPCVIPM